MFQLDPAFIKPTYDSHGFTAIPRSIAGLLGAPAPIALPAEFFGKAPAAAQAVVVLLLDGFGWRFFEKAASNYPALRRFLDEGVAARFTAQFPSTTSAHLTCLHTGLEVGQSGIYEWNLYEPALDAVITPLLFSFAGSKTRDQLKDVGFNPARLYPPRTVYEELARSGIASFILSHREYTPSTYSDAMYRGVNAAIGCRTLPEALANLRQLLAERRGPAYYVLYFDRFDGLCHEYGPGSPQAEAELDTFLTALERLFLAKPARGQGDTLFILTADHGEVETDPETTIYLNVDRRFAGLERSLKTDRRGQPLVAAGAARDFFLHVQDARLDEVQATLAERLAGRAAVYRTADLIAAGFFGARPPAAAFLGRVGNLVILPYAGEAVWWYEKDRFEQQFYGHHGGLTPQELAIPFLMLAR